MPTDLVTRGLAEVEVRSIDEKTRSAEFVIATQRGVDMGYGDPEHLLMSGVDLTRYAKNPVVLDSHKYYEGLGAVVGGAREMPRADGRFLVSRIHFADTARGEDAWKLVKGGFLRTTSIGYVVTQELHVGEGEEWEDPADKEFKVKGSAIVGLKWKLYEISMAPLPADEDACLRARQRRETMADDAPKVPAVPATPVAPAPVPEELPEVRAEKIRAATIRAIAPEKLRGLADRLVLEGKPLEEARIALLAALAQGAPPVGTPDGPRKADAKEPEIRDVKDIPLETLKRCLTGSI